MVIAYYFSIYFGLSRLNAMVKESGLYQVFDDSRVMKKIRLCLTLMLLGISTGLFAHMSAAAFATPFYTSSFFANSIRREANHYTVIGIAPAASQEEAQHARGSFSVYGIRQGVTHDRYSSGDPVIQVQAMVPAFATLEEETVTVQTAHGIVPVLKKQNDSPVLLALSLDVIPKELLAEGDYLPFGLAKTASARELLASEAVSQMHFECWVEPGAARGMRQFLQKFGIQANRGTSHKEVTQYEKLAKQYADKYNISAELVLAIMRVESNFNPFAVSPRQALGLMQIVQATAGGEVHAFLTGKQGAPSLEELLQPEMNIKYGAVYLYLLGKHHFGAIQNKTSRDLCVIAAYNSGPGTVLNIFSSRSATALQKINSLSPEELYTALVEGLPSQESRRYVASVLGNLRSQ